jgi:diadenosine tetraphosphate (Ap4A) HIT family hydrolase
MEAAGEERGSACPFCLPAAEDVILRAGPCVALWTREQPEGSAMVLPERHATSPFDLTPAEWKATHELLITLKKMLDADFAPGGYNIGWNVGNVGGQSVAHTHCHLVPRYGDELFAGRGIRSWIKSDENHRT